MASTLLVRNPEVGELGKIVSMQTDHIARNGPVADQIQLNVDYGVLQPAAVEEPGGARVVVQQYVWQQDICDGLGFCSRVPKGLQRCDEALYEGNRIRVEGRSISAWIDRVENILALAMVEHRVDCRPKQEYLDRKSTRLNSSHRTISYAVFCLKRKTA